MFGRSNNKVKVDIDPASGKVAETYPSLLNGKMSAKEWKSFCDSIQQAYNEEKQATKSSRNCCFLWSAIVTIPLIIPPIFIIQKYCKGQQNRSASRLKDFCNPICNKATKESQDFTFTYNIKLEKEEGQQYNDETQQYDKMTRKIPKHYITVKKK